MTVVWCIKYSQELQLKLLYITDVERLSVGQVIHNVFYGSYQVEYWQLYFEQHGIILILTHPCCLLLLIWSLITSGIQGSPIYSH